MEAKYRLVTTWPEDSVQVRDRTSNEILVEMKPHELVTMKNTFDQAREVLKMVVKEVECYCADGVANRQPCARCEAVEAVAAMEDAGR